MATTKRRLAEQIQREYARFLDKENITGTDESIDRRELYLQIEQCINNILSVETIQRFQNGTLDVIQSSVATYENIAVTSTSDNRAQAILPVTPLSLPMGVGVWQIYDTENPFKPYIPLNPVELNVLGIGFDNTTNDQNEGLNASYLEGQIGYVVNGKKVLFNVDITTMGVTLISTQLIVHSIDEYHENELLPLNAEYEKQVILQVLQLIASGIVGQQELNSKKNNPRR